MDALRAGVCFRLAKRKAGQWPTQTMGKRAVGRTVLRRKLCKRKARRVQLCGAECDCGQGKRDQVRCWWRAKVCLIFLDAKALPHLSRISNLPCRSSSASLKRCCTATDLTSLTAVIEWVWPTPDQRSSSTTEQQSARPLNEKPPVLILGHAAANLFLRMEIETTTTSLSSPSSALLPLLNYWCSKSSKRQVGPEKPEWYQPKDLWEAVLSGTYGLL